MTIAKWLTNSMVSLKSSGVDAPRTDCLVFLCDALGKEKSWIHAHPEEELTEQQLAQLTIWLERREQHEPLAYIRGKIEFYGREFSVDSRVLIPRPESEAFIELLKSLSLNEPRIADIGTGSGCLGITAKLEVPAAQVDLYDVDSGALSRADQNAHSLDAVVKLYKSDLLAKLRGSYDVLLANLPYVPEGLITSPEIGKEPELALFSGKDGLDHYRRFWVQISQLKHPPRYILTESLESQHKALEKLAYECGYHLEKTNGLVYLCTFTS